jgi:hypothetical protein
VFPKVLQNFIKRCVGLKKVPYKLGKLVHLPSKKCCKINLKNHKVSFKKGFKILKNLCLISHTVVDTTMSECSMSPMLGKNPIL